MTPKKLQIMGAFLAIPLAVFAISNNYWAEPEPPTRAVPTVVIETGPAYTEFEEVLTVETIKDASTEQTDDLYLLAACIEAEAGNQSVLGRRLVADVILNRVDSPMYPDTIRDVIYQPGQLTVVDNGAIDRVIPSAETWEAIYKELANRIDDTILFFQAGYYGPYGKPWEQVGGHWFSTGG